MKRICICGGGSLGHAIAGYLSAKKDVEVNILTQRPQLWKHELHIFTPEGITLYGRLNSSRYFQEDFMYGLRYIYQEDHRQGVTVPTIDEVYHWGRRLAGSVNI